jgi:lipid A 3-O-deacylase
MGPFVNYGNGLIDRTDYHFFAAGFQAGRVMTPMIHAGALSGRFEYGVNVMPLFQAYTPAARYEEVTSPNNNVATEEYIGGGTFTGASVTPVVFRWNFGEEHKRVLPWFQAQAGVLWTNHKFPPVLSPVAEPEGTSIWNFRSGAGVGMHCFTDPQHSVDFALNVEHISSASLGDKNPGVNASLQFQVGYTWWK